MGLSFKSFVGVDWSGAERSYKKKLAIAVCEDDGESPKLIEGSRGWTRTKFFELILENFCRNTLIGIDFAFSYPYVDRASYFPGHRKSPESPRDLWRLVEEAAGGDADFYGGRLIKENYLGLVDYYRTWKGTGFSFSKRFRSTEGLLRKPGALPKSVFQVVGDGQVGMGTLAGMRLLHMLKNWSENQIAVWPFDEFQDGQTVIVEVYPALFRQTLSHLTSFEDRARSKDENDALISAAALRELCSREETWRPMATNQTVLYEGWIFGCPGDSATKSKLEAKTCPM